MLDVSKYLSQRSRNGDTDDGDGIFYFPSR